MPPFPRMHYDDAVKLLHKGHDEGALETRFEWGGDFGAPDETYLSGKLRQAADGPSLSGGSEGVLHGARSGEK